MVCCRFDAFPPDDEMKAYVLRYFSGDDSFSGSIAAVKRVLAMAFDFAHYGPAPVTML